ncbi:response regulator [Pseudomonas koreensis]|uniref:response regulator transcription factor n=1 Tax=Pseudomonas koreensis TaxID=198620 RepID=UPI0021C86245|nr:response regulator [Pseudomonas koreensis]MCU0070036.1 response regulator [Pseudomonas koreensis]
MSSTAVITIVDDDESVRTALDGLLRSSGYTVRTYASAEAFLASDGPDVASCLISDIQMPGMSGIQLHKILLETGTKIPTIFITGNPNIALLPEARCLPVFPKPFHCGELLKCIERLLGDRS